MDLGTHCSNGSQEGEKSWRSSGSITDLWVLSRWGNAVPNPKKRHLLGSAARWLRFPGQFVWAQILPLCTTVWPQTSYITPLVLSFRKQKIKIIVICVESVSSCLANSAAINMGEPEWLYYSVIYLTFADPSPRADIHRWKVLRVRVF